MAQNPQRDVETGEGAMPGVGCQIVMSPGPAQRLDSAERLDPILPLAWDLETDFHRTTDDGIDLYFVRIETRNNRVPLSAIEAFGDDFMEVQRQQSIERAKEDAPEEFEEAVEALGRRRALEMFAEMGISDDTGLRLFARPMEPTTVDIDAEVLLRVVFEAPVTEGQVDAVVRREFMGQLLRTERVGPGTYLFGGELTASVGAVRRTVSELENTLAIRRGKTALVCHTRERQGVR